MSNRSILLLSGSYVFGSGFLDPYEDTIRAFMEGIAKIIFVPYAADSTNWDNYTLTVRERFAKFNIFVDGIHEPAIGHKLPKDCKAIFIGGGNTFRLLYQLQQHNLLPAIRSAVLDSGLRYMGSSAGSNIACKTICTTNDMPIIYPEKGFDGLNLLPLQINPHYIDPDPDSKHKGETRQERIREFHEQHTTPVIGLREGAYLKVDDEYFSSQQLFLGGNNGAKFFFKGKEPINVTGSGKLIISEVNCQKFM